MNFKKYILTAVVCVLTTYYAKAQMVINELMQSNIDCVMDDINEFPDSWVELYNTGTTAVNLQNYKIGLTEKWSITDTYYTLMVGKGEFVPLDDLAKCDDITEQLGWPDYLIDFDTLA